MARQKESGWWRKPLMRRTKGFCQSTTKSPSCFTHEAFNAESNADLQAILCVCLCRICVECGQFLCCIHFADMCSIQCREMNKCVARKARIADHNGNGGISPLRGKNAGIYGVTYSKGWFRLSVFSAYDTWLWVAYGRGATCCG